MRILIVDDNEVAIEILRATLAQAGYEVECAFNGRHLVQVFGGEQLVADKHVGCEKQGGDTGCFQLRRLQGYSIALEIGWQPVRCTRARNLVQGAGVASGLPFSTTYIATSLRVPAPVLRASCFAPPGTTNPSPALILSAGWLSIRIWPSPSRT